jgi:hypothetical protein
MSMNAIDALSSASAMRRATVVLPEPEPPAIPMMSGFTGCDRWMDLAAREWE